MPKLICDTSPIQYLHQLGLLRKLPEIADHVIVPEAVIEELDSGRARGVDLPETSEMEWMAVETPRGVDILPLVTSLGRGEKQVLALALERPGSITVLDDLLARTFVEALSVPLTGTLGILLDFKHVAIIDRVVVYLDRLEMLGFRLSTATRNAVLTLAGEDE